MYKARIAFITTIADTQWHFLRGQNRFLIDRGYEVHAIAAPGDALRRLQERDGVSIHPVPMSRRVRPWQDLAAVVRLYRILRRIQPDLVHVSTPKAALLGGIAAWLARAPARVFLVRGLILEGASGWRRRVLTQLEKLTAAFCNRVLFVSPSVMSLAVETGVVSSRTGVIAGAGMSNGIDASRFDPRLVEPAAVPELPASDAVVGFAGRLARDKGIDELAAAWRHLRERLPQATLLLVGDWDRTSPVSDEVRRELEADSRVHVTGFVDDPAPFYRAMSVFAFPSRREGFPNAPMEAAAMQLPVVAASAVGNVDAVIDGVTGTLTPRGDAAALAHAIERYLLSPELRRRHGRAGRQRVLREFRQEHVWRLMLCEFETLLDERGTSCDPLPRCVLGEAA